MNINRTKISASLALASLAAAVPLLAGSISNAAQVNLIDNGDFSQGMTGWDDWFPSLSNIYVTNDEHLFIQGKTAKAEWHFHSVARCIPTIPDSPQYTMSADLLFPPGQGRTGYARVRVQAYDAPNCASNQAVYTDKLVGPADGWQSKSWTIDAPAGTKSFRYTLGVETWAVQGAEDPTITLWAEFDNAAITADVPDEEPPGDPTPVDPTPVDPQDPGDTPADPTPVDPQDPGDPPGDPTPVDPQDPGEPPSGPDNPGPWVPKPWPIPVYPEGPLDVVIPGPLGGTPAADPSSSPVKDEPHATPTPVTATPVTETATPTATAVSVEAPADAALAGATPLPPTAGAGRAPEGEHGTLFALAGALLALGGGVSTAWSFGARRRQR